MDNKSRVDLIPELFEWMVLQSYRENDLVRQFDRIYGANLSRRLSPLENKIDVASGKEKADMEAFVKFVREFIYDPMIQQHGFEIWFEDA